MMIELHLVRLSIRTLNLGNEFQELREIVDSIKS